MLTIRFARVGKRNKAQFKIVLQERTASPQGRHVEVLGSYEPHLKQAILEGERIKYWLSKGAHLSDTMHNLLVSKGVITGAKRKVKVSAKKAEEAKPEEKAEVKKEKKSASAQAAADKPAEKPKKEAKSEAKPEKKPKEEVSKKEEKAEAPKGEVKK